MADHENENQNEEEMEEEILINQEEGEGEGQDFYAIEMQINDEPYLIVIGKTEENKIFLRLMNKEDQNKPFFHNEFSLEDLKNINPIFNGIESEDIAFQYLVSNLNDAEKESIKTYPQGRGLFVCGSRRMIIDVVLTQDELDSFGGGGGL